MIDSADLRESDGGLKAWKARVKPVLDEAPSIPLVVASHPHADHIAGLPWLLENYGAKVGLLVDNGRPYDMEKKTFAKYVGLRDAMTVEHYDKAVPWPSQVELCGGTVKATYWVAEGFVDKQCIADPNICSVFLHLQYGKTKMLLTGDAEKESEHALLESEGSGWTWTS